MKEKSRKQGINSENTEILEAFSERLSYTRLGTLENEQALSFIFGDISLSAVCSTKKTQNLCWFFDCFSISLGIIFQ